MDVTTLLIAWVVVTAVVSGAVYFMFSGDTDPFEKDGGPKTMGKVSLLCFVSVYLYRYVDDIGLLWVALITLFCGFIGARTFFYANFLQAIVVFLMNFVLAMYAVILTERFIS